MLQRNPGFQLIFQQPVIEFRPEVPVTREVRYRLKGVDREVIQVKGEDRATIALKGLDA